MLVHPTHGLLYDADLGRKHSPARRHRRRARRHPHHQPRCRRPRRPRLRHLRPRRRDRCRYDAAAAPATLAATIAASQYVLPRRPHRLTRRPRRRLHRALPPSPPTTSRLIAAAISAEASSCQLATYELA